MQLRRTVIIIMVSVPSNSTIRAAPTVIQPSPPLLEGGAVVQVSTSTSAAAGHVIAQATGTMITLSEVVCIAFTTHPIFMTIGTNS